MAYYPGGPGNDTLVGSDAADLFEGKDGDDIIYPLKRSAGGNWDVVQGGAGFDTIRVDASAETSPISALQFLGGYELKSTSGNYWIIADTDIERVEITGGSGKDVLQGLNGDDILKGGAGDDTLDGSFGFDILDGGAGNDTVDQRFYNGAINANLTLGRTSFPGQAGVDTLISIESFYSGNGNDSLTGNEKANVLAAGGGNDVINGRDGKDRLFGAAGDDRINGGNQDDFLYGGADDDELFGGSGKDVLFGESGDDDLNGGPGYDILDGGLGFDRLNGGADNDEVRYEFYNKATIVNLSTGRTTFVGLSGFERLVSIEHVIMGDGNDTVIGNGVRNILVGAGGSDTLKGNGGNDSLYGDGALTLGQGPAGRDRLEGGGGNDVLYGLGGNDTLIGDAGADQLWGGSGGDRFVINRYLDSRRDDPDWIRDFDRREGDRINLAGIDANVKVGGNQAFTFIGSGFFTEKAGQLRVWKNSKYFIVDGDVNGDGIADLRIRVSSSSNISESDIIL